MIHDALRSRLLAARLNFQNVSPEFLRNFSRENIKRYSNLENPSRPVRRLKGRINKYSNLAIIESMREQGISRNSTRSVERNFTTPESFKRTSSTSHVRISVGCTVFHPEDLRGLRSSRE